MKTRTQALIEEYEWNDKSPAPSENQLKWDMRHIREDMMLMCKQQNHTNILLFLILIVLILVILKI